MIELRRVGLKLDFLSPKTKLTVVVPLRAMEDRDILDRITYCIEDRELNRDEVDFLVVDDGSHQAFSLECMKMCESNRISYIYLDTEHKVFSISRARNVGAMYAKSKYIIFMDVDLFPYDGFYNDILDEIEIQNLESFANDFIMIGVIYLTEKGGDEFFFTAEREKRKNNLIQKLLESDEELIDKFSTGTSVNVYNRRSFLSHGGNDEAFEAWGYDDLEYNFRMIRLSHKFPIPEELYLDYKNFRSIKEYKGWKSIYRLFGDITFQKGIVLAHIWHKVDKKSNYMQGKEKNRRLFEEKIKAFKNDRREPAVLPCMHSGKTLLFTKTNPFVYNRKVLAFLGIIVFKEEEEFTENSIVEYIKEHKIDRVLMFNPYGSEHRLSLYKALRKEEIPVLVAERGALRDSVFYDWNGFNAESTSYSKKFWDFELSKEQYEKVHQYIQEETQTSVSLEKQNEMIGANRLREKLNISVDKKVLFVPLQRPSDSVIKYFCGDIKSYDNFISLVQKVTDSLGSEWVVVAKKHPLEDEVKNLEGVIFSEANIKDLLEMCDYTLLINSGVGLLAMLWNKPVLYCGEVFYSDDRINKHVNSVEDILYYLNNHFVPNTETIYRFIYYLIDVFYSFGRFTVKEVPWEEGGRMTVTTDIEFYRVRNIHSAEPMNFYIDAKPRITTESILFDRYTFKKSGQGGVTAFSKKRKNIRLKKLQKFKESPERFFKESKNPFNRLIGSLIW